MVSGGRAQRQNCAIGTGDVTLAVGGEQPHPAPGGRAARAHTGAMDLPALDRKSTRLNSSHVEISYAVFCLKKKKKATFMNQDSHYVNSMLRPSLTTSAVTID